jgi:hypothetical protein
MTVAGNAPELTLFHWRGLPAVKNEPLAPKPCLTRPAGCVWQRTKDVRSHNLPLSRLTTLEETLTIAGATAALPVGGARNVLMLLAVGLTIWLCLGALVAQLFGAFVDRGRQSREDEDDQGTADTESRSRPLKGVATMTARRAPRRHWFSYSTDPLPTGAEALDEPFGAFPSWFLRIECDVCGKVQMVNEAHMKRGAMPIRDIIARMPHNGCGGRAGRAELLTGIEGVSIRPVRRIVLLG